MKEQKEHKYKLSIIIVNWNSAQLLKKCIQSIYKYSPKFKFEIIVFDNGSTEDCRPILKNFPDVKSIFHPDNLGFTAACNRAAQLSTGEFLLFLNPDTEMFYDVLTPSIEFLETQNFAILGVRLILPNGRIQISSGNFPSLSVSLFQNFYLFLGKIKFKFLIPILTKITKVPISQHIQETGLWDPEQIHYVDWVSGAYLLILQKDFFKYGKFDEHFIMFAQEFDLCYRLKQHGIKTVYLGTEYIYHYSSGSMREFKLGNSLARIKAMIKFYRKHLPIWQVFTYKVLLILGHFINTILSIISIFFKRNKSIATKLSEIKIQIKFFTQLLVLKKENIFYS